MKRIVEGLITYTVTLEPESKQVKGNASAVSPEVDADCETWVYDQLRKGNMAAWCCAKVTATLSYGIHDFEGVAYLGCCSYADEAECEAEMLHDDYGLKGDALADLRARLKEAVSRGEAGAELLKRLDQGHLS